MKDGGRGDLLKKWGCRRMKDWFQCVNEKLHERKKENRKREKNGFKAKLFTATYSDF